MEINPIIVIGVARDGDADLDAIKTNWRRATETGIGCVIINNDTNTDGVNKAKKARAYVYVPDYAGEQTTTNYETDSGAERVQRALAEFDRFYNYNIVINVPARLPEMAADVIKLLMYPLADFQVRVSTFVDPISEEEAQSEDIVKAKIETHPTRRIHGLTNSQVAERTGFSRKIEDLGPPPYYRQVPIYAYRRGFLDQFVHHRPTVREMEENIKDASVDDLKADTVAKVLAAPAGSGA